MELNFKNVSAGIIYRSLAMLFIPALLIDVGKNEEKPSDSNIKLSENDKVKEL